MKLTTKLKLTISIGLGLLLLLLVSPYYLTNCVLKARWYHMQLVAVGITHFSHAHDRLPRSLAELESDHFLPSKSDIYACPLRHGRFFLLPRIALANMEYDLTFNESKVVIRLKPFERAFANRFLLTDPSGAELVVNSGDGEIHTFPPIR